MAYNNKSNPVVIVTRNSVFVGRYLTNTLLKKGYYVFGFDLIKTKDDYALKHENFQRILCYVFVGVLKMLHSFFIQLRSNQLIKVWILINIWPLI